MIEDVCSVVRDAAQSTRETFSMYDVPCYCDGSIWRIGFRPKRIVDEERIGLCKVSHQCVMHLGSGKRMYQVISAQPNPE
jgi:hypothetical protein